MINTESSVIAFGAHSEEYISRFPLGIHAIFCDGTQSAEALAAAAKLRGAGEPFYVAPMLTDSRAVIARIFAHAVFGWFSSYDEQRPYFEAIARGSLTHNNQNIRDMSYYPPQTVESMRQFLRMGDALLVRSESERQAVERLLRCMPPYHAVAPLSDTSIPAAFPDAYSTQIVVWGPNETAENLALYAFALWNLKTQVIFICRGALPNTPHIYVSPHEAGKILTKASTIVDTNLLDPGAALTFATRGFGITAASTSGAQEYIQGMTSYDPADFSSILSAVCRARGVRNHHVAIPAVSTNSLQAILDLSLPPIPEHPPLVSIVVPTYNRRRGLHATLMSLARQTYPNLEVIVVNDAGEAVEDIVDKFSFARCITLQDNCKTTRAANVGLASAQGEFVGLLCDDDLDYPSHVAAIIASLQMSNLDVAHSNILIRLDTTLENGKRATYGHLLAHDGHLDNYEILYDMRISVQGCIIRTSTFRDLHFLNPVRSLASDYDLLLRLSSQHDFVHADTVTGEYSYRDDQSNISRQDKTTLPAEIEELLSEHCPEQYPSMTIRHEATVRSVTIAHQRDVFYHPAIPLQTPHILSDE